MPVEEEESSNYSSSEEEEKQQGKKATAVTSPAPTRPISRSGGQTTAPVPPAVSPSSSSQSVDSEEESDDEDEDPEDEDDEPEPVKSQSATPLGSQKAGQSKAPSLGSVVAKPLNSKPMDGKTVKPSEPTSQAKPKRPLDSSKEDESKKKKKKKKKKEEEAEEGDLAADVEAKKEDKSDGSKAPQDQKKLFQRVWDAEDEINLLTTLFEYKKGGGSANDLNGFFKFSRKDLEKFKKTQLADKVRKLKKKYENIISREKSSGKTAAFKTSHDKDAFSLSQSIWGEKGKDTPQKEKNEASGQRSPRKDGGTAVKKSKNSDGGGKQLDNNRTKVSARKQEEPDSSLSKDENHVRFFENMEIGVGRTKEDGTGSTVVNMVEVVDKWIKLADQSKVEHLQERQRKLEGRMLEIHSEHLEIASARAKLALEAFKTAKAGRSRQ